MESLAGERTSLNLRHFRYWDAILAQVGEAMKTDVGARHPRAGTASRTSSREFRKANDSHAASRLTGENEEHDPRPGGGRVARVGRCVHRRRESNTCPMRKRATRSGSRCWLEAPAAGLKPADVDA